jgi:hypothetical protein
LGDEVFGTDLFGDPVQKLREGPGRPEVVWNKETSDRVLLGFARGLTVKAVAEIVALSVPTLRKVYFSECAKRKTALLRLEMAQLVRLNTAAAAGNVGADRELARRLDQLRMRDNAAKDQSPRPSAVVKPGKKEAAMAAALEQRGLYEPPTGPQPVSHATH